MKAPGSNGGPNGRVFRLGFDDAVRAGLTDQPLEREFLHALLVHPEILATSGVVETDFASTINRAAFNAISYLVAEGEPVDSIRVRARLCDRGMPSHAADDYLAELTGGIPLADGPWQRIRSLARRRRIFELAQTVAAKSGDEELPRYLDQLAAARRELDELLTPAQRIPLLADYVHTIELVGERLATGLPTLDAALRGGIPAGRVIALVGSPGASKTNFATWLGDAWERQRCAVMFLAADESREAIITRVGQLDGHPRELLEGQDEGRRNAFVRNARGRSWSVVDPVDDRITLEDSEALLVQLAAGRPRVLIVDSVQTIPCAAAEALETMRDRVTAVMTCIRGIARRGTTVIAISEMSRAGYATGKRDMDRSVLASGAESRAVEYYAHLLLGLKPVRGESGVIDVETGKNRIGTDKPDLRVRLDFDTLQLREVERPVDEESDLEHKRALALRERVLAVVAKNPGLRTRQAIARLAGARNRAVASVISELTEEGVLSRGGDGFVIRPAWSGGTN